MRSRCPKEDAKKGCELLYLSEQPHIIFCNTSVFFLCHWTSSSVKFLVLREVQEHVYKNARWCQHYGTPCSHIQFQGILPSSVTVTCSMLWVLLHQSRVRRHRRTVVSREGPEKASVTCRLTCLTLPAIFNYNSKSIAKMGTSEVVRVHMQKPWIH